ncbi:MAG: ATP-binding protein [Bacteroidetes bacterium]|nr:ATP-binding protein [Bacteroidota bacterium]MBU2586443.1 ATP-binding protein [Bacteroidota bacterium]
MKVTLTIENNFDPDIGNKQGEGIGLKNIKERLRLIYNMDDLIRINKNENIFKVEILIPVY